MVHRSVIFEGVTCGHSTLPREVASAQNGRRKLGFRLKHADFHRFRLDSCAPCVYSMLADPQISLAYHSPGNHPRSPHFAPLHATSSIEVGPHPSLWNQAPINSRTPRRSALTCGNPSLDGEAAAAFKLSLLHLRQHHELIGHHDDGGFGRGQVHRLVDALIALGDLHGDDRHGFVRGWAFLTGQSH